MRPIDSVFRLSEHAKPFPALNHSSFHAADGSPCQDGTCKSGECQLTQAALEHRRKCPPIADKPCTICLWSERLQTCIFKNADDGTKCSDGNPCTYDDSCKAGKCVGMPKQCNNYYGLFGADGAYKSKYCMTYACNPKTGKCEPEAKEGKFVWVGVCSSGWVMCIRCGSSCSSNIDSCLLCSLRAVLQALSSEKM